MVCWIWQSSFTPHGLLLTDSLFMLVILCNTFSLCQTPDRKTLYCIIEYIIHNAPSDWSGNMLWTPIQVRIIGSFITFNQESKMSCISIYKIKMRFGIITKISCSSTFTFPDLYVRNNFAYKPKDYSTVTKTLFINNWCFLHQLINQRSLVLTVLYIIPTYKKISLTGWYISLMTFLIRASGHRGLVSLVWNTVQFLNLSQLRKILGYISRTILYGRNMSENNTQRPINCWVYQAQH